MVTRLDKLKMALTKFEREVATPARANTGGPTWEAVQKAATLVPASLTSPIRSIEQYRASQFSNDLHKVPTHINNLTAQLNAINTTPITKYQAAHSASRAKPRATLTAAKAEEAQRVALCEKFMEQYLEIQQIVASIQKPEDLGKR